MGVSVGVGGRYQSDKLGIRLLMYQRRFLLPFFAAVGMLASCALLTGPTPEKQPVLFKERTELLAKYMSRYRDMITWGHYDEAAGYLRSNEGTKTPTDLKQITRYRVTDYDVKKRLLTDDGHEAWVVAIIQYYELDNGLLNTLRDEQLWWYDEVEERWYLGSSLPQFRVE